MNQKFRQEDGPDEATRLLVPVGDLDATTPDDMRRRVDQALAAGKRRVIVDLSEATFMETSALSALLDANARARRFGASILVVVPPGSPARRLISTSRLDHVLRVVGSREEALLAS